MNRAELEGMDRPTLIAQAEALGVTRANILTRPELMDELLVRTAKKDELPRARGLFGRARDLVARVIEKGLHLPDAAERLRQASARAAPIAGRAAPAVVPTVTLAEIYAAQGHRGRAIETLRRVMELEPDHGAAQALLTKLETAPVTIPPAVPPPPPEEDEEAVPPTTAEEPDAEPAPAAETAHAAPEEAPPNGPVSEPDAATDPLPTTPRRGVELRPRARRALNERGEPVGFLDDDPLPIRYDVDECVAIAVDPTTLYVYWEVRDDTLGHAKRLRPDGSLTLRLLVITPSWDGPRSAIRDFDVDAAIANRVVRDLPAGAVVRAAVGWRTGDVFLPIAHAPALETPPGAAASAVAGSFVRWTPRGFAPVTPEDRDFGVIGRALDHLPPRREAPYELAPSPLGSSELSAGFSPGAAEERPRTAASSEAMIG